MNTGNGEALIVNFRGVRGSLPSPAPGNMRYGGNTSCVELRCGGQLLILDSGSGIRSLGEELIQNPGAAPSETALLISHTHWDHIQGLPFFGPGYLEENRIALFVGPGRASQIQSALINQMSPSHFPVGFNHMRGLGAITELSAGQTRVGNLVVRTTELNHPGGCTGFRIDSASASVAYLPDHEPYHSVTTSTAEVSAAQRELIEFVRDVDLLILDTQYTTEEYAKRVGWGHGCLADSVQLATDGNARRLLLFHHDPSHGDDQIDRMIEIARSLTGESRLTIDAAAENQPIVLASSGEIATTGCLLSDVNLHSPIAMPVDPGQIRISQR